MGPYTVIFTSIEFMIFVTCYKRIVISKMVKSSNLSADKNGIIPALSHSHICLSQNHLNVSVSVKK